MAKGMRKIIILLSCSISFALQDPALAETTTVDLNFELTNQSIWQAGNADTISIDNFYGVDIGGSLHLDFLAEDTVGFIVLISAVGWHFAEKRYFFAVLGSTLTTIIVFQIAVLLSVGYFDPYYTLAMAVLGTLTAAISAVIGIPFLVFRKRKK